MSVLCLPDGDDCPAARGADQIAQSINRRFVQFRTAAAISRLAIPVQGERPVREHRYE